MNAHWRILLMKVLFGEIPIDCTAIAFDKDGTLIDRYIFWNKLYENRIFVMRDSLDQETITFWQSLNGVSGNREEIDPGGPFAVGSFEEEKIVLAAAIYKVEKNSWD
jgi:hypothetical protein